MFKVWEVVEPKQKLKSPKKILPSAKCFMIFSERAGSDFDEGIRVKALLRTKFLRDAFSIELALVIRTLNN